MPTAIRNLFDPVLIGADTPRCRAYAAAVEHSGTGPVRGVFYAGPAAGRGRSPLEGETIGGIWYPPVGESVGDIFSRNGWEQQWLDASTINEAGVREALKESRAPFAIFAGKPGEIVSSDVLAQGIPILHLHPGALPAQRGSTTIYYSILEKKPICVSSLLLAPEIDAGPVLEVREYPVPPPGIDIDISFDSAVRSDALVHIMAWYRREGQLPPALPCGRGEGELYFVVHPILKHIALLSISSRIF